ncbi:MAG: hypothetical protein JWQ04_1802 [Pedosphaera sp.]|nr:hypothetical protein [Pedosphaera sp.]
MTIEATPEKGLPARSVRGPAKKGNPYFEIGRRMGAAMAAGWLLYGYFLNIILEKYRSEGKGTKAQCQKHGSEINTASFIGIPLCSKGMRR